MDNNMFYDISKNTLCLTYGTFAIGMNKRMIIELRKSIDIRNIMCPIDVHISDVMMKKRLSGKVLYPFLIMPDVTYSDNRTKRDQKEFTATRSYQIDDYYFVSMGQIQEFKQMMSMQKISLRKMFKPNNMKLSCEEFLKTINNKHDENDNSTRSFFRDYFDCFNVNGTLDMNDFFYCIEEKKSFCFIIKTFDVVNYRICIESIMKQIYPCYQYRIIFCGIDRIGKKYLNQYIKKNELTESITFVDEINIKTISEHCFDDEIMIELNGNQWLFNEYVLDNLNNIYSQNKINGLSASGYWYNLSDMRTGQSMGIPYGKEIRECFKSRYVKSIDSLIENNYLSIDEPLIVCDKTTKSINESSDQFNSIKLFMN